MGIWYTCFTLFGRAGQDRPAAGRADRMVTFVLKQNFRDFIFSNFNTVFECLRESQQ